MEKIQMNQRQLKFNKIIKLLFTTLLVLLLQIAMMPAAAVETKAEEGPETYEHHDVSEKINTVQNLT